VAAAVMNSFGRTAAAVVVAASLFGYIYFVESKKEAKKDETSDATPVREKVFAGLDKLKVKVITLKKRDGDIISAEKRGDAWTLVTPQETPADAGEVSTLLDALQNLETEDVVSESTDDLSSFGLDEPKVAVWLVVEGAPKPLEFELGDAVPAGSGLFARVPGKPRLFTVSSTLENTLDKSAFDLRDRNLLKVKKDAIQSIESIDKGKTVFKVVHGVPGDDDWRIETPVATRAARWTVDSFLGLVENLRMEKIVTETATPKDLTQYGLGAAARRLVIGVTGGKTTVLQIGKKTDDSKYYAREGSSTLVATISPALVDDLDKGLKNLRASRLLDVAAYEVIGFDVTAAGSNRMFSKTSTKDKEGVEQVTWKAGAPAKDATQEKVTDALFAVGGLEAAEFIDQPKPAATYGLDAPAVRVTIRFDGDKKEDWFEVSIKGDEAFGRRRDDAAVLKLDKAKTEALIKSFTVLGS
jgi:hypothetical protein